MTLRAACRANAATGLQGKGWRRGALPVTRCLLTLFWGWRYMPVVHHLGTAYPAFAAQHAALSRTCHICSKVTCHVCLDLDHQDRLAPNFQPPC